LIANESVQKQIADLKIVNEAKYLDHFGTMLANDEYSAVYGFKLTEFCIGKCAVKILMVLDKLYRSKDLEQRKKYFAICESARNENLAEVIVFSSLTESGKELERMGGIAAILKYPVHEIDEVEFEV
ncbi:MAG: Translation factor pelota, partial [Paramarteilia canceri]